MSGGAVHKNCMPCIFIELLLLSHIYWNYPVPSISLSFSPTVCPRTIGTIPYLHNYWTEFNQTSF